MAGIDDISGVADGSPARYVRRRDFLEIFLGLGLGATAAILPCDALGAGGWNISYGLAKGDDGLVSLGKRYDEVKKALSPALARRLVIEKSPKGNYFLVLKLNTSANRAQGMIKGFRAKGIDAALRRYCGCEVVFPPTGASSPAPRPRPAPKPEPVRPMQVERHVTPAPQPAPQPVRPAPVPKTEPAPAPKYVPPPSRITGDPDYASVRDLSIGTLESAMQRQFALEKQRGVLSGREVLYAYVEDGYDMPVMLNSNARIKGAWTSAEAFAEAVQESDFDAAIHDRRLARQGSLVSLLPQGARSRSRRASSAGFLGEGAVIYAQKKGGRDYHSYSVVIGIRGSSPAGSKRAAMARLSRLVYEAVRSRSPVE